MMDCKTGTLIDLSTSPESGQECNVLSVPSGLRKLSLLGEPSWDLGLKKELNNGVDKPAHSSPPCGVLIDLEFSELALDNGSVLAKTLMRSCQDSKFAEQNNSGLMHEKSSIGSLHLKNKGCNKNTSSCKNVDFPRSPSVICKDVDLLENEEFSFTFESISPDRENACQSENIPEKWDSQMKTPEVSTPQNRTLLSGAFTPQISEEAAKVVTYLSAKNNFLKKSEADSENILSVSNLSFSGTEIQNFLLGNNVSGYNSSKNDTVDDFLWADEHNSAYNAECFRSELPSTIMEVGVKLPNMAYGSSANTTAAVQVENCVDNEDKENIPMCATQFSVLLEATERELLNSSQTMNFSPLVRRETFAVKPVTSQESRSATRNKIVSGDEEEKMKLLTSKSTMHKIYQSPSFNSCSLFSSHSNKVDSPHPPLIHKDSYTTGIRRNFKNLVVTGDQTSSGGSRNAPKPVDRIASSAGKVKAVSSSKSPKGNSASTPKTPKIRKSLLPSKLTYSESRGTLQSKIRGSSSSVQQSSQKKSSSFQRLKTIEPLSNLVKSPSVKISGANVTSVGGNKGKIHSLASKGPRSVNSKAVPKSEPAKCLGSCSTPRRSQLGPSYRQGSLL